MRGLDGMGTWKNHPGQRARQGWAGQIANIGFTLVDESTEFCFSCHFQDVYSHIILITERYGTERMPILSLLLNGVEMNE